MARPTIGLVMIVRNEEKVLPRLASSLAEKIDHWTIVDTGSTDDTRGLAKRLFGGIPGQLIEDTFRGFGPSRNIALDAAEPHSDWLLTIDADHTLHGAFTDEVLNSDADAVDIEERYGELRYWIARLLRSGRGWRWHGRTHEYLDTTTGSPKHERTSAIWVQHHADGGNRKEKFIRDVGLLQEDWEEKPGDPRTAFYLARTFDDLGWDHQAIDWYHKRVELEGWIEERFYSRWRLGVCLLRSGAVDEGCGALWRAWSERPWRAEPLVSLAEHYRGVSAWELAWEVTQLGFRYCGALPDGAHVREVPDALFVHSSAVGWRIAYESSICAWYVDKRERGRDLTRFLLSAEGVPDWAQSSILANAEIYGIREPDPDERRTTQ